MMTSSEMTERYVGGNYSPAVAGAIGLLMASLFFASAFFIFRRPVVTVAILAALMLIQVLAVVVADTGAAPVDVVTGVMLVLSFVIWRWGNDTARYSKNPALPTHSKEKLFCTQCGERVSPDDYYCGVCGKSLQSDERALEPEKIRLDRDDQGGDAVSRTLLWMGQAIVAIGGLIVMSETSMFIAFMTWRAFGPLSLILTLPFWFFYPIWWLWRYLLGVFV